jgi:transcriptional regulator with XRE-family HTH domain
MPEPVTEGQRLLQAVSSADNLTLERIAEQVGCAPAPVMQWLRGESRPNNEMRARLFGAYGITGHA